MSVELNSFVWASAGIEPQNPEDAVYTAGDQPIAGYDNFVMWAVTEDIHAQNDYLVSHSHDHQAGGSQELNLDGLGVGSAATLVDDGGQLSLEYSGTSFVTIDGDGETVETFPAFNTRINASNGLETAGSIRRADGDVVYDYSNDIFHRADEANHATDADHALDSDALGGDPPSAFIQPDDPSHTITGEWEYTNAVDADILGNAATANFAAEADHAAVADQANDSDALEGEPRATFAEHEADEDITGAWAFLSGLDHVNADVFEQYAGVNTSDSLQFRNGDDRFEFVPMPGGLASADDYFGYDFDEEYWNFGQNVYVGGDEVVTQSDVTNVENQLFDPSDDYTITGEWEYTNLIGGEIEEAQHADDADHALEADHADAADHADTADLADEAEYAHDSNRVDGYHAEELINMMGGGGSGKWELLTTEQFSAGDDWEFNFDPDHVYDQYRVAIVLEGHGSGMRRLWMHLNEDHRARYFYFKHNRFDHGYELVDERQQYFPLCLTYGGETAYGEYVLTSMPDINGGTDNFPGISRMEYVANPTAAGGTLDYGYLESNYDSIHHIQLEPYGQCAARIHIYGSDFPSL